MIAGFVTKVFITNNLYISHRSPRKSKKMYVNAVSDTKRVEEANTLEVNINTMH